MSLNVSLHLSNSNRTINQSSNLILQKSQERNNLKQQLVIYDRNRPLDIMK